MLEKGMKAPEFSLLNQNGETVNLSDFKGKKVILYFYPRDNTPGCTKQACAFKEENESFKNQNAVVIGVSKDSVASHFKFMTKYDLPFMLLSDPTLEMLQNYGVWVEKKLYGKIGFGIQRSTFIINEEGIIEEIMHKVKPATNAADILELIKQ